MGQFKLLNGAFTAELVKSKSGQMVWEYIPNFAKLGKIPYKGSEKEVAQFGITDKAEGGSSKQYQLQLRTTVIELVQQLKSFSDDTTTK